jgi:uncharacterized protein YbgA (DUF1722 family)
MRIDAVIDNVRAGEESPTTTQVAFAKWYTKRFPDGFEMDAEYLFEAYCAGIEVSRGVDVGD